MSSSYTNDPFEALLKLRRPIMVVMALIMGFVLFSAAGLGYVLNDVEDDEAGIIFVQNSPVGVVGPGVYTDYGPQNLFMYKRIETIKVKAYPFTATDAEVLTSDQQRLGVVVTGTVRRPSVKEANTLLSDWATYKHFYIGDEKLLVSGADSLMQQLSAQAVKVCVGDRTFDTAVVGSARDLLGECIETELGQRAQTYGLLVANVVVPNFVLSNKVQDQLDEITQSRLAKSVADQQKLQKTAEAERDAAIQRGSIIVEQGKVQEKAIQDAKTAELAIRAYDAQYAQIEAQKKNELFAANQDITVYEARRQAALMQAEAELAPKLAEARIYQGNLTYASLLMTQAMAAAYKNTDKVIVVPEGTNPVAFLGDSGRAAVVPVPGR